MSYLIKFLILKIIDFKDIDRFKLNNIKNIGIVI